MVFFVELLQLRTIHLTSPAVVSTRGTPPLAHFTRRPLELGCPEQTPKYHFSIVLCQLMTTIMKVIGFQVLCC